MRIVIGYDKKKGNFFL
jgi:hypothetical protein